MKNLVYYLDAPGGSFTPTEEEIGDPLDLLRAVSRSKIGSKATCVLIRDGRIAAVEEVEKAIGMLDAINQTIQDCEANWIRQNQPQIWEKTSKNLPLR